MTAGRSIIAAALLVSSLRCISQNSRINLDVRLVLVTVTVTDSHKRFVQGLQKGSPDLGRQNRADAGYLFQ